MDSNQGKPESILSRSTLADLSAHEAIELLGTAIDAALDNGSVAVLRHIVGNLANTVDRDAAAEDDLCLLDYFLANAWNGIKFLSSSQPGGGWEWESSPTEQETVCIRRALISDGLLKQPVHRVCQIHTNLGNCLNTTGRFVEAISEWDRALSIAPRFGMARGNRAVGLWTYARSVYDDGHRGVLAREAWQGLDPEKLEGLEAGAGDYFAGVRAEIEKLLPEGFLRSSIDLAGFDLGDSEQERAYRQWCLTHRLFLNSLNDIGSVNIAAQDILTCPSVVTAIGEGPRFHDVMNQIKQEYCSARWLAFDATRQQGPHLSDKDVLLYNTLDYPSYGLRTEQLKLSFRSLYSLFDKIAFFLNAYLTLGIAERKVSFRGLWYVNQNRSSGIRAEFTARANWPLRGLFWLGKDLYQESDGFREAIDPAGRRLNEIRNHLEHKYLKVHSDLWTGSASSHFTDGLAVSLSLDEFEATVMHLLRMTRASIIYLTLGVHCEERVRARKRGDDAITPPMILDVWEDDWKK